MEREGKEKKVKSQRSKVKSRKAEGRDSSKCSVHSLVSWHGTMDGNTLTTLNERLSLRTDG